MFDATTVQVGDVLAGKYRVERVLGAGGMGVVVAARHLQLDQRVALKFLKIEAASEISIKRFLREARAAAQVRGEHVARISDVGTLDDGSPFMVMELLEGRDLGAELEARGALPVMQVVDYVLQACEAVAEAHAAGVVHRDLKPSNLFLTHRPGGAALVKVLDFGISKVLGGSESLEPSLTGTSALLGSPRYMSPEQLRGTKNVDARTDIWSLGVIIYELLSGTIPFEAETLPGLLAQIAADPPRPIAEVCANLPDGLAAIVMRCLEKDPARRFTNVGELAVALLPYAAPTSRVSIERILAILGISFPAAQSAAAVPSTTVTIAGSVARSPITPHTSTSFGQTGGEGGRSKRSPFVWLALPGSLVVIGVAWFGLRAVRPEAKTSAEMAAEKASGTTTSIQAPGAIGSNADRGSSAPVTSASAAPALSRDMNAADAEARSSGSTAQDDLLAPLTGSARAAPSATSAPVEPRRVTTQSSAKPPVRRPSNPIRSQPLSNILDGRE